MAKPDTGGPRTPRTGTSLERGAVKSLVRLLEPLLQDCGRMCGVPTSLDRKTARERSEHEGDSFLTITLPRFCADFERSLSQGRVTPDLFRSFSKRKGSEIPAFLQGFLCRVFTRQGDLLDSPSIDCIRAIRQICLFCKKVQRPCSQARTDAATEAFVQCDGDVVTELQGRVWEKFKAISNLLVSELFPDDSWKDDFLPRHGPGATRERISGNQKWVFRRWHLRMELAGIKYWRYAKATSWPAYISSSPLPAFIAPRDEEPVRVVFVPKTLASPRVIAVEPVCMQYAQQGLMRVLVKRLERSRLTAGSVNFTNQSINQDFALEGSSGGGYATLDLSEASDRVGLLHVRTMLQACPGFLEWAEACRSTRAQLPNGEVIHLSKWASMGSALCFPIESMVFFVSIMASIMSRMDLPVTSRMLSSLRGCVKVFGDDLIVPEFLAPSIVDDLEALGFKVNRRKSFWTGKFRESCGLDAYDGEDVTPCYIRRDAPNDATDVAGLLSWVSTCNQLQNAGYAKTASALQATVERLVGKLPEVQPNSSAIGWTFPSEFVARTRWNSALQRREFLAWVPAPAREPDPFNGNEQALAKCFRVIGEESIDRKHLQRSVRPYALSLKRKWVPTT